MQRVPSQRGALSAYMVTALLIGVLQLCVNSNALAAGRTSGAKKKENPHWRILVLLYPETELKLGGDTFKAKMTEAELRKAEETCAAFAMTDIPELTDRMMIPIMTIRHVDHPLTNVSGKAGDQWPTPSDTMEDWDKSYDSIIVIWDSTGTMQSSGKNRDLLGWGAGRAGCDSRIKQLYSMAKIDGLVPSHRGVLKHEWGHSIMWQLGWFGNPKAPFVDNHNAGKYVCLKTGKSYQNQPKGNVLGNFTHDYYSGNIAGKGNPKIPMGGIPSAWAQGGPITKKVERITGPRVVIESNFAAVLGSVAKTLGEKAPASIKKLKGDIAVLTKPKPFKKGSMLARRANSAAYTQRRVDTLISSRLRRVCTDIRACGAKPDAIGKAIKQLLNVEAVVSAVDDPKRKGHIKLNATFTSGIATKLRGKALFSVTPKEALAVPFRVQYINVPGKLMKHIAVRREYAGKPFDVAVEARFMIGKTRITVKRQCRYTPTR